MSGLLPWSDGCTGGLPSSVLSQLVVRPDTCYAQGDVLIDSSTGESIAFVRGPRDLRGGPDRARRLPVGRVAQGRPRLGRAGPPRFRQRSAQPACRWRKSQLRQGFPGHQRLVPPNVAFRCEFVARRVAVRTTWRLWVSANEKRAMAAALDRC